MAKKYYKIYIHFVSTLQKLPKTCIKKYLKAIGIDIKNIKIQNSLNFSSKDDNILLFLIRNSTIEYFKIQ
jgi:hypothetical protein